MISLIVSILITLTAFMGNNSVGNNPSKAILKGHNQIIIVVSKAWNDSTAEMWFFQRKDSNKKWKQNGEKIDCDLGTNGFAWGRSLIKTDKFEGPVKHEGDNKSPAGIFKLPFSFGFYPKYDVKWIKFPYVQIDSSMECVDDTTSKYYNEAADRNKVKKVDWNSSEKMRKIDEYEYGLFIGNNWKPAVKSKGSCIFLHIWDQPRKSTEGCTAISKDNIISLLKWLKPNEHPLLIQLTKEYYQRFRKEMGLPELKI